MLDWESIKEKAQKISDDVSAIADEISASAKEIVADAKTAAQNISDKAIGMWESEEVVQARTKAKEAAIHAK